MVRVGDFGLARDVYSHLYYRTDKHSRIPVKWSAPEMLKDGLCTEKSDVVGLSYSSNIPIIHAIMRLMTPHCAVVIWSGVLGGVQFGEHPLSRNR